MKKLLTLWLLCVFAGGSLFAQTAEAAETAEAVEAETVFPKNTITVDIGPTFYLLLLMGIYQYISEDTVKASGVGLQYERHITEKVSVAGRVEYGGMGISSNDFFWNMHAVSAEGHGRYYPGTGVFFADGTLGYTAVFMDLSTSNSPAQAVTHHFKFGIKIGWSIDFGKPGGFTIEPAIGYYGSVGTKLKIFDYGEGYEAASNTLNLLYSLLVQGLFIGGPRFSFGLGYKF